MSRSTTSIIYLSNEQNVGALTKVKNLFGLKITSISGTFDKCFGMTESESYCIATGEKETLPEAQIVCGGKYHNVALTSEGSLYSWGVGKNGELGLGNRISEITYPTRIKYDAKLVIISSGHFHSCGLDNNGILHGWGQNFDKQLALYRKGEKGLPKHCLIEDMMMVPRCIPFSLQNPIKHVSCGSKFTCVVTRVSVLQALYM